MGALTGLSGVRLNLFLCDYTIRLWHMDTGLCVRTFEHVQFAGFVVDWIERQFFSFGGRDDHGRISLWNLDSGDCIRTYTGRNYTCWMMCIAVDTIKRVAFTKPDRSLRRLDEK